MELGDFQNQLKEKDKSDMVISKSSNTFRNWLLIIFGTLVICFVISTYLVYNGDLNLATSNQVCESTNINITCPSDNFVCPSLSCPSVNSTCNPEIKIYLNNS